jgi:hypothetical protein
VTSLANIFLIASGVDNDGKFATKISDTFATDVIAAAGKFYHRNNVNGRKSLLPLCDVNYIGHKKTNAAIGHTR